MENYRVKNWKKFQQFKDRRPPWIRLYRDILDDPDWHALEPKLAKRLVMIWLIASEDENLEGQLPCARKLAFRLRVSESELQQTLTSLSPWLIRDDITTISERYQSDAPETETETETETESTLTSASAEPEKAPVSAPATDRVYMTFPVRGKTKTWELRSKHLNDLRVGFPDVDLIAECKIALTWCYTHPHKQKTASGMTRFLYRWISEDVNKGVAVMKPGKAPKAKPATQQPKTFRDALMDADMRRQKALEAEAEQERRSIEAKSRQAGQPEGIGTVLAGMNAAANGGKG